jgi:hypothetical protein
VHLDCASSVPLLRRRDTSSDWRRLHNNTLGPTILHLLAVDTWREASVIGTCTDSVAVLVVDIFDIEGVDVAGEVSVSRKYAVTTKRYWRM